MTNKTKLSKEEQELKLALDSIIKSHDDMDEKLLEITATF